MPHFLKSLELNGFKSFAQKTSLEFPAGITAIVGPNGSGKSNIVDAIRWLLGERETKNLRGGKVEDLIFAGTPERPRQSLAEASLHFKNESGFFPVDWNEISVMRQVSRDGTGRYFLNQSEIRLKDLVDFFAKARLGTKGLIVVTQGNSDLFMRASPGERREMIEEMLGLREYQIKKVRAENQLKSTEINLGKVQALVEEILPHLRSLRRQTIRWEKRALLEEELKNTENTLFGSEWRWLEGEIAKIQKDIENHQGELSSLKEEKNQAEKRQREVESNQPKEREELKGIKLQTQNLLEKQIHLEKDLGRFEAQLEIASKKPEPLPPSTTKLIDLLKKIRVNLRESLGKNLDDLRRAIQHLLEEIDSGLTAPREEKPVVFPPSFKSQFEKVNQELAVIKKEILTLRDKEKSLEKSQGEFYESFKTAVTALELAKSKIEEWDLKNQKTIFERERLKIRFEELKRQIVQAGRRPEEFRHLSPALSLNLSHGLESPELRELERKSLKTRGDLASIGEIDQAVMQEAKGTEERYEFLKRELEDTEKAQADLKQLISDLNNKIKTEFDAALHEINKEFNNLFRLMFDGGHAKLVFKKKEKTLQKEKSAEDEESAAPPEDQNSLEESRAEGVEIVIGLPQKKISSLEILSGGERSLVGIAALFAMIAVSPPPFLVLDEIDAALDERNTRRFAEMLKSFSKKTQFIIVTHNRASMEVADVLYGVTLNNDGTSKIISLKIKS